MREHEIVDHAAKFDGVLVVSARAGDGSPEISWGDTFCYFAPDGKVPAAQPFATIVTKDYPNEPSSALDRPGAFRLNIDVGADEFERVLGVRPRDATDTYDITAVDTWFPHPVYGRAGWLSVVEPGERTSYEAMALLEFAARSSR